MADINRREFFKQVPNNLFGIYAGYSTLFANASSRIMGANDRIILALIGAGSRGRRLVTDMTKLKNVEVKIVCEIDKNRGDNVIQELKEIQGYYPKRLLEMREAFDDKDVDAVVIATPEHWHALATVWACQAGKDVYVEKNISLTPWESRKAIEAARKYNCIVQCGTQNRSAPYAFSARKYIKDGKLGKVVHVKCYCMLPGSGGWKPVADSPVPEGLDWDRWLGPAREVPYNSGRHRDWYSWWDYSGGLSLAGDASHVLDLARMVMGDPDHPVSVYHAGGRIAYPDQRETPDMQAITYDYRHFTMTCESSAFGSYMKKSGNDVRYSDKFPDWRQNATRIEIYGTERMMYLGRHGGGWQVMEVDNNLVDYDYGYFPDKYHQADFLDCIRSRKVPNGDIEQGHYSACLVHLANLAYRVGNKQLLFDSESECFTNSTEANSLLKPLYRKHYRIPDHL